MRHSGAIDLPSSLDSRSGTATIFGPRGVTTYLYCAHDCFVGMCERELPEIGLLDSYKFMSEIEYQLRLPARMFG